MRKNRIKLTESDLNKIIKESVKKVLKEDTGNIVNQFAQLLATDFSMSTAEFIANELARTGQDTINTMEFIVNHMNGYGYGGPDVNGNVNY
jgi:uncharacterized membrane protein